MVIVIFYSFLTQQQKMERISRGTPLRPKKSKLPTIPHNKSNQTLKNHELTISPPQHLQQLRKLYYQYKSNANILSHSPYYTNRQQQKHLVSYIQANKCEVTSQQIKNIQDRFSISQEGRSNRREGEGKCVSVRLHCFGVILDVQVRVATVEELEMLLKKQFALQELKATGGLKKVDQIGGFGSVKSNSNIDFMLAHRNGAIAPGKYELQAWFYESLKGDIQLKHFRIIRCLGSGGFSLVYLAQDKIKGNIHALKLIDKQFILESQREIIVENERFVLGELINSPFITPLRFCFETKNHFAFAIQYCPGGELFYQLKKVKRMTEEQAKFYFLQILVGLDQLHAKGIIYRDLKPQNLLIGADGHVMIADFGLAKPLQGRPAAYSFCGSPEYMAPEMLKKSGHGVGIDYYCLGALLYELIIGVPPYYSLQHEEIYQGVLYEELAFPDNIDLSRDIQNILGGLLEKDPSKRLGSMHGLKQIMIHPWIGRISRKQIEGKQLKPPFMPDLADFNFDQSQLGNRNRQTSKKIAEDMRCTTFQTHFSHEFYYCDSSFVPEPPAKKAKTKRSIQVRSLQKRRGQGSLMRRVASDRGKSK